MLGSGNQALPAGGGTISGCGDMRGVINLRATVPSRPLRKRKDGRTALGF